MVDAKNVIVCEVFDGGDGVAEYIVERCNDYRRVMVKGFEA